MASGSKKTRAKWTPDIERRLIDIWADIIEEFSGKMITRKKKEAIATTRLNAYLTEELRRTNVYTEKAICNKIDTILKNGKKMYATYQKKGETGKEYTEEDAEIDLEANFARSTSTPWCTTATTVDFPIAYNAAS